MSHYSDPPRIYLDNAATSWPKPEAVYQAVEHYQRHLGAPAGRGGYGEAVTVSRAVDDARRQIAALVGLSDPTHLIFTANGTDSLNLVLHGLLGHGEHVITSDVEHNSVLRPLEHLAAAGQITITRVGCNAAGLVDPDAIRAALRSDTRLIALAHASNVTGALQPIAEVGRIAREAGVLFLCDAAQTAGHIPIDIDALHVDFLAASGHKGLLGPLGTGILAIRPQIAARLDSVRQGGTGTQSEQMRQPGELPWKFEAGNLNVPGILGMRAGAEYLVGRGLSNLEREGRKLTARLLDGFAEIKGLRVLGPASAEERVPLVSVVLEGYDPQEVALSLDAGYRIQVRSGLHCAPAMHRALGTDKSGGTVRFSLGPFTTPAQVDATINAVAEVASSELWI